MSWTSKLAGGAAAAALLYAPAWAAPGGLGEAIAQGKPILGLRTRYEHVDQKGIANTGEALTLRTVVGWETAGWRGFKGLIEIEDVSRLAAERYNVASPGIAGGSLNGRTAYPIINDPGVTELNRAQLSWIAGPALTLTGGRQRIVFDDARFVGDIAWRQDQQTFDAVRADFAFGRLKGSYVYVDNVNRVLGEKADWRSDSHLFNAGYAFSEPLRLQAFVYALDFANAPVSSTLTWGAKASGKLKAGRVGVAYNATFARQRDYRGNTAPFGLDDYSGDVAATFGVWTARAGFEVMEGDGARGFIMPLSTAHAFNGWSDAFAAVGGNKTFPDGVRDLNLQLVARPKLKLRYLSGVELLARYHDFDGQRTGAALGHEWDAQATAALTKHLSVALKYADFKRATRVPVGAATPPASRSKVWVTIEYRL